MRPWQRTVKMKIHNHRYSPVLKRGLAIVRLKKGTDRWPVLNLPKVSSWLNSLLSLLREVPASRLLRITWPNQAIKVTTDVPDTHNRPNPCSLRDRPNLLNERTAKRLLALLGSDFHRIPLGSGQAARSH